eukprot:s549_g8.t4
MLCRHICRESAHCKVTKLGSVVSSRASDYSSKSTASRRDSVKWPSNSEGLPSVPLRDSGLRVAVIKPIHDTAASSTSQGPRRYAAVAALTLRAPGDCRRGSPADRPLSSPNALATVTATRSNSVRWLRALATLLGCGEACLPSVVTSAAPLPQRLALRAACRCDVRHGAACEMQPPHSSPKTSSEECNVEGQ